MKNKTTQLKKEVALENLELFRMQQRYNELTNKRSVEGIALYVRIENKRIRLTPKEIVLKINET